MTITHQTVLGSDGKPAAALIPWQEFLQIRELLDGDDLTASEAEGLREAEADRRAGNESAFTDLTDLKAELSL